MSLVWEMKAELGSWVGCLPSSLQRVGWFLKNSWTN